MGQIQKQWQGKEEKEECMCGRVGVMDPCDESGFQKVDKKPEISGTLPDSGC